MLMGVVTFPNEEHGGDGKISLHRISKRKQRLRNSHDCKFVDCGQLNNLIRQGDWRNLYSPELDHDGNSLTVGEFLEMIGEYYEMEEDIASRLSLSYESKARTRMKRFDLCWDNDEEPLIGDRLIKRMDGTHVPLTINDLNLFVFHKAGEWVEEDCSCASEYMRSIMPRIGMEIKTYFDWVPDDQEIYLVIDNAGGHGTTTCVRNYTQMMKDDYNIVLKHQVPNSPETNLLDLGVWRSLQSKVEKMSYRHRQDPDVLAKTAQKTWAELPASVMDKVYRKWKRVVQYLIPLDDGGNRYVEQCRGKLTNDPNATQEDEDTAFVELIERIKADRAAGIA